MHKERMDMAESVAHGKTKGFVPVGMSTYQSTIEARKMLRAARKKTG
jgi:hypothetical protein